jgi:RNA polymerase sigma-70 factor, ECF subfamily
VAGIADSLLSYIVEHWSDKVAGEQGGNVTRLLRELAEGRQNAESELIPLVYGELHRIARRLMRGEGRHTLQPTALVHEAYLRLVRPQPNDWQDRTHFFRVAATVMRRILVDHARSRQAQKRGGDAIKEAFSEPLVSLFDTAGDSERILVVDEALTRLSKFDERQARIVELRFFVGMTVEETADALQMSSRTVKREWQLARAWLLGELST